MFPNRIGQLGKLDEEILNAPQVSEALELFTAFEIGDHAAFFKFYRGCDLLSAIALSSKVDTIRYKALVNIARAGHASLADRYPLDELCRLLCLETDRGYAIRFLQFCGLRVELADASAGAAALTAASAAVKKAQEKCGGTAGVFF